MPPARDRSPARGSTRSTSSRAGSRLTLAPLALGDAASALLDATGSIRVPASDVGEFVRDHLPRISRQIEVIPRGGLELPAIGAPALIVGVGFRPEHTTDVRLEWEYAGLGRFPFGSDADRERDEAAEADLRARADAAWRESGMAGPPASQTLRGIESAEFVARTVPALEAVDGVADRAHRRAPAIHRADRRARDQHQHGGELGPRLVRPRRHRDDRRAPHPVRPAADRPDPAPHQAAARGRALLLARAPRARPAAGAAGRGRDTGRVGDLATDQPPSGRSLGRLRGSGRPGRARRVVASDRRGPARRATDRADAGTHRAHRRAPAVPTRRIRLARIPLAASPGRHPRRRHGPGQDAADAVADRARARNGGAAGRSSSWRRRRSCRSGAAKRNGSPRTCASRRSPQRARSPVALSARSPHPPTSSSRRTRCCASTRPSSRRGLGGARARRGAVRQEPPDETAPRSSRSASGR